MPTTTTVCVVAQDATRRVQATAAVASNVVAEVAGDHEPAEAWGRARRRRAVYTLVDVDPLDAVVVEWAKRLSGEEHQLELAIGNVRRSPSPDYYLVSDTLKGTKLHWYLGLLVDLSPTRVLTVGGTVDDLLGALRTRRTGRGLPALADLATEARRYVPTGLSGA